VFDQKEDKQEQRCNKKLMEFQKEEKTKNERNEKSRYHPMESM
jgi:hypothetical protein